MTNEIGRFLRKVGETLWDAQPKNDPSQGPIWLLGQQYHPHPHNHPPRKPRRSSAAETDTSLISISQASVTSTAPTSIGGAAVNEDPDLKDYDQVGPAPKPQPQSHPSQQQAHNDQPPEPTPIPQVENAALEEIPEESTWPIAFLDDFESRIWMTYRSAFPPIPRSIDPKANSAITWQVKSFNLLQKDGFTSDTGWGCMIRSGQSLLANALSIIHLGRDWRRGQKPEQEKALLALFADDPRAPFSVHRFVEHGAAACGKHPGEWFGPSATASCIQSLTNGYQEAGMKVYTSDDASSIYEDKLMQVARDADGKFTPTLILVGTRLGIQGVTPVYYEALKAALQMEQSVGIAGGQPSSSHYFVGTQASNLFYLDPHTTRPALPLYPTPSDYTDDEVSSCHVRRLRRTDVSRIDPSMLIAFLVRDEDDWRAWRSGVEMVQGKPVVRVLDREPDYGVGRGVERAGAVDEVESCSDDDSNDETIIGRGDAR